MHEQFFQLPVFCNGQRDLIKKGENNLQREVIGVQHWHWLPELCLRCAQKGHGCLQWSWRKARLQSDLIWNQDAELTLECFNRQRVTWSWARALPEQPWSCLDPEQTQLWGRAVLGGSRKVWSCSAVAQVRNLFVKSKFGQLTPSCSRTNCMFLLSISSSASSDISGSSWGCITHWGREFLLLQPLGLL